jgi:hypothetical protein
MKAAKGGMRNDRVCKRRRSNGFNGDVKKYLQKVRMHRAMTIGDDMTFLQNENATERPSIFDARNAGVMCARSVMYARQDGSNEEKREGER